ncbi:hypothetical protein QJQ45_021105, partial [Haematococcus lacustris]
MCPCAMCCLSRFGAKAQWHLPSARSSNHNGNKCDGQLSSQSGSKEQQAPSPPSPLHSTPLFFPMPLLPPPPHLLPSHPPPPPLPHPYPGQEEHG